MRPLGALARGALACAALAVACALAGVWTGDPRWFGTGAILAAASWVAVIVSVAHDA